MKLQHVISLLEKTIKNKTEYQQELIKNEEELDYLIVEYLEVNLEELNNILDHLRQVKEI